LLDPAVQITYNLAVTQALEILLNYIIYRITLVWSLEISQWSTNYDVAGH